MAGVIFVLGSLEVNVASKVDGIYGVLYPKIILDSCDHPENVYAIAELLRRSENRPEQHSLLKW